MIEGLHVESIAGMPQDKPVIMLNLMKFRAESLDGDGSGWDAYVRYSKVANQLIKQRSGRIVWAGKALGATFGPQVHGDWDFTALVSYPTVDAFRDMMECDEYRDANVHRHNGCEAHLIMAIEETFNGM